jgi:hypothetical protein
MIGLLSFIFSVFMLPLGVAALAGLTVAVMPHQARRARDCVVRYPVNAGAAGLLTLAVVLGLTWFWELSTVMVIPVCLFPVIVVIWMILGIGLFFGWVVVAESFGRVMLARMGIYDTPMVGAVCGALTLGAGLALLGYTPCVGWLANVAIAILAAIGFGAALLTRGGTRAYPPSTIHRVVTETDTA